MTDASRLPDDRVAAFQIAGQPVRGRIVSMGPAIAAVLSAHAYPAPVAELLGEACALAALIGSALKFDGRLIVQAQGGTSAVTTAPRGLSAATAATTRTNSPPLPPMTPAPAPTACWARASSS